MDVSTSFRAILLEIAVGITVLGSGSVARVAQVSGLTWQHIFPRLVPAPQAFTRDERPKRLSTEPGTVVGVYSGNLRSELNFFACLLHPKELGKNEVELVEVRRKAKSQDEQQNGVARSAGNVYRAREFGPLIVPSFLGMIASGGLLYLSVRSHDTFAIAATVLLSVSSTIIGFASSWKLDLKEKELAKDREQHIPAGDVLIYYSRLGAFRVVRCDELIADMYFRMESCDYVLGETMYRATWLLSAMILMASIICIRRSQPDQLMAFSVSYIALNVLYWLCAAMEPKQWHWTHDFTVIVKHCRFDDTGELSSILDDSRQAGADLEGNRQDADAQSPHRKQSLSRRLTRRLTLKDMDVSLRLPAKNFTEALWTAIALVGHSDWVYHARVAPDNGPWRLWVEEAGKAATLWDFGKDKESAASKNKLAKAPRKFFDSDGTVILPVWNHHERLTDLLKAEPPWKKRAPDLDTLIALEQAGYFPSPAVTIGEVGEASSSAGDPQQQVASTGTDVNQSGLTLSPDDQGHLAPTGARHRRTRSRENRRKMEEEDVKSTEPDHTTNEDERPSTPLLSQEIPYASGGLADKEKDGV